MNDMNWITSDVYNIKSDEEFAKWLQHRSKMFLGLALIGALAILFTVLNSWQGWLENDYMEAVCSGMGGALIAVSVVTWLKNRRICAQPELLHKMRLRYTDERNRSIGNKALATAAYMTILGCWVAMMVSGWFSRVAIYCFEGVMFFCLICYLGCYYYYNSKM